MKNFKNYSLSGRELEDSEQFEATDKCGILLLTRITKSKKFCVNRSNDDIG